MRPEALTDQNDPGYIQSALKAAKQTLTFYGRSGHRELFGYYFFSLLAGLIGVFTASFFVTPELNTQIIYALNCLIFLPFPALLVRRLHDQGRTGKLALLLVPPTLYLAVSSLASLLGGTEGRIAFDQNTYLAFWPVQACTIAVLVFYLLPGTIGPNRFGEDPRRRAVTPPN